MNPRHPGRTQTCGRPQANTRLAHANKFFDAAELIATDIDEDDANASVAASLAVLAGIAASDAACCARLGRRSRSQDHHDAERLLTEIVPAGRDAAKDLRRLLDLKDTAQYGVMHVSATELRSALRRASALRRFASDILGGNGAQHH
ncbi:MAG TPA: hypothetical protein VMU55_00800 [Solirubrobacteraceae bacterium]|nr:hypothetical protein [Solirubrobacteraceae bacterium]